MEVITSSSIKTKFFENKKSDCVECIMKAEFRVLFIDDTSFLVETSQGYTFFGSLHHKTSGSKANIYYLWADWNTMNKISIPVKPGMYLKHPFPDLVLKIQGLNANSLFELETLQKLLFKRINVIPKHYRIAFPILIGSSNLHRALNLCDEPVDCRHNESMKTLIRQRIHFHNNFLAILMSFQGIGLNFISDVMKLYPEVAFSASFCQKQYNAIKEILEEDDSNTIILADRHLGNFVFWPEPRIITLKRDSMLTFPLSLIDYNQPPRFNSTPIAGLESLLSKVIPKKLSSERQNDVYNPPAEGIKHSLGRLGKYIITTPERKK